MTKKQQALNARTPGIYRNRGYKQETLWIRRMGAYELHRLKLTDGFGKHPRPVVELTAAFSTDGHYIGESRRAWMLVKKYQIERFAKIWGTSNVASTGFSPKRQKWYGWSHRAIFGFGVGQLIKPGHLGSERIRRPRRIKTLAEARRCARSFAAAVS